MIAYRLEEQHRVYFKCILVCYKASKKHFFFTFLSVFQSLDKLLPSATRPERALSSVHSAGGQIDGEKKSARRHFNFRKRETLFCNSLPPAKRKDCASTYISNQERKSERKEKKCILCVITITINRNYRRRRRRRPRGKRR